MSNSVGSNLLLCQNLLRPNLTKNQCIFISSGISVNNLNQGYSQARKLSFWSTFWGNHLVALNQRWLMGIYRLNYVHPQAILAISSKSEVDVSPPTAGSISQLHIQVTYGGGHLLLHWGAIQDRKMDWLLPSCRPEGTSLYKNRALRTPFVKSGDKSILRIDIDDPSVQAVEFLVLDEANNKWYKNNGGNFNVKLRRQEKMNPIVTVPKDLVQIHSYLRWEQKGKQPYTPQQEEREFEEARKELQFELDNGTSVDEMRKKLTKGRMGTEDSKQFQNKSYSTVGSMRRERRDLLQIINKYVVEPIEECFSSEPKALTELELFANEKKELEGVSTLNKKNFKIANKELMVLVTRAADKMKVYLATDFQESLTLHWALSKNAGEWLAPHSSELPFASVSLDMATDTPFAHTSVDSPYQLQLVEIDIKSDAYVGMPFVLFSDGKWIKNNGSDFYVEFFVRLKDPQKDSRDGKGTAKALLDRIAELESEAQKSFMHRFNIATDLIMQAKDSGVFGFAGILVWMRFMATRQLIWNKNYNVKPREISKAQDRLTESLQNIFINEPQYREVLRMIMSTIGRGGQGDVGQRIRDEILVLQRNNDCKGAMMEEWHQKLHNNTSPDDVVICQALIDYIKNDFDIGAYWRTLNANGITKERLLSYDRGIHSEPTFRRDQKDSLLRDLRHYLKTLKAVHSGADLESAISNCLGYRSEGQGFMVGVQINPVPGLSSGFSELMRFVLDHIEDRNVEALIESLLEARQGLRPLLSKSKDRLKDLLFLDIALDSTLRTTMERGYEELNDAGPEVIMRFITLVLENLALSSDHNEDMVYCIKGWIYALEMMNNKDDDWALYSKSVLDRTRLALATKADWFQKIFQPSAVYLGSQLGVDQGAVNIFTEEIIRSGSAASLSSLLNRLDPVLRMTANLGSWQVICPVEATGYVVVVNELLSVQNEVYERPTVLVVKHVKGEEEIPDGIVAVLTSDMPDVLSHVSVRARNSKVCFATCFDSEIMSDLQACKGKLLHVKPTSTDIIYRVENESEETSASSISLKEDGPPSLKLVKKEFNGRYAISSAEFTNENVGAKSRNISYLKGKVPSWIGIPSSVALPFGVFEKVLYDEQNKSVAKKFQTLIKKLEKEVSVLKEIHYTVLQLTAPTQLVHELKHQMKSIGMPWPGDENDLRWKQAWMAIKKVWASKWNERAYLSTRKVKLDHDQICMAVLVQEVINADYAFVIHTTNPSSGDTSEIYAEIVKGLGETLVGAFLGRALSFICKKNNLDNPKVLGYPSKPVALSLKKSIIFRSDSNAEDLEGYAGAGLYDSVAMDEEEEVIVDYTSEALIVNGEYRQSILSGIARAGSAIEALYGCAQDIEGVVSDGEIYVVQTRPQMPTNGTRGFFQARGLNLGVISKSGAWVGEGLNLEKICKLDIRIAILGVAKNIYNYI